MRLLWTAPALRDLDAIDTYIAKGDPAAATRITSAILDQTELLAMHPHIGRIGRVPETRELVITHTPYIVPYRVRDADVEILAVFHGSRQWPPEFS